MSSPQKQPRLMRSTLTGTVYVVTRYKDLGEGRIEATQKYDVTDDFMFILGQIAGDAE